MIALGCDHGGYALKEEIKKYLEEIGIEYKDVGAYNEERTDYSKYAQKVAEIVQKNQNNLGILICRTGSEMAMVANKFKGVRAVVCLDESYAKQAKEHLNANIIAIPGENTNISLAVQIIRTWIGAEFLGGIYSERLENVKEIENKNMK